MKRRRINRVLLVLQSVAAGGMETHVIDLAAEYARRDIATTVVVPEAEAFDDVAVRVAAGGATPVRLDTDARNGRRAQLRRWLRLARLISATRPDAIHLHTGGATGGLAIIATTRAISRATAVITEHDVPAADPSRRQRQTRRALDQLAHCVVAVSRRNALLRRARLGMGCRNFAAILNGVPLPDTCVDETVAHRAAIRAGLHIAPDAVVIGSLVRLAPGKGLDTLLEAFAIVRRERACRLLLVGDGPLRTELEAQAVALGVGDDVIFAGNQAQPGPYLEAMDVFALAVPAGSMSIALLEAMARRLPPVITFGGPEEAVIDGETGLTPPPNDSPALAAALRSLVEDRELRTELGAAAQRHVARHFSVSRVADDLLEVYATARDGGIARRLSAFAPPNPRPGDVAPAATRTAVPR
jgi:glycosyltransferase involved in cell wall biosynthesis